MKRCKQSSEEWIELVQIWDGDGFLKAVTLDGKEYPTPEQTMPTLVITGKDVTEVKQIRYMSRETAQHVYPLFPPK